MTRERIVKQMNILWATLLALMTCLAVACSGGDDEDATLTATSVPQTSTPLPEVSPTVAPTVTQGPPLLPSPPGPGRAVPKTVWLVDVAAGTSQTLAEDYESLAVSATFSDGGKRILLAENLAVTAYDLMGVEIGPAPAESCSVEDEGEQIDGRWHPLVDCPASGTATYMGPFRSPDGRWFTYRLEITPGTSSGPPTSEMWALDIETGERHLLHEMQDCGGCDGRFSPAWSPSGRYLFFAETGGDARVFLSDLDARITRVIAHGNQVFDRPQWANDKDVLLYKAPDGTAIIEDVASGTRSSVGGLVWPAAFDLSGDHVYSPSFVQLPKEQEPSFTTRVIPTATLDGSIELDGGPELLNHYRGSMQVVDGPHVTAALIGASGCSGMQLYTKGTRLTCVEGGTGAALSPDGRLVAISRKTGASGPVTFPGGGAAEGFNLYEVVVIDLDSGAETVVGQDAVGQQAPSVEWNNDSRHLLIEWPLNRGL